MLCLNGFELYSRWVPLKLGLQQFNLNSARQRKSYMHVQPKCKSYKHVNPQCKSKNRDNSALLIPTDQLITTSQNKWKEG